MKLVKCVIPHDFYHYQFYCKMGEIVEEKSSVLLGFKDRLPVITNSGQNCKINSEIPIKKILKLQVDPNTGEKFINLNGKKLKMVPESQIKSQLYSKDQKNISVKVPSGLRVLTKVDFKPNFIQKLLPVKTESQVNLIKAESVNPNISQPSVLREMNLISEKNPHTDIVDKQVFGNDLNNKITTDKCQLHTNCVTEDRLKCDTQTTSSNTIDMKAYRNEKEVQTLDTQKYDMISKSTENLKDVAIQTEPFHSENSLDDILSIFNDDDLLNIVDPVFVNPPHQVNFPNSKPNIAAKFFSELRRAHFPDHEGNMPIHVGIVTNNFNLVRKSCFILKNILQQTVDLKNNNDLTPLQLAVMHGTDKTIIEHLLSKNASLEVTDAEGNNVIHLAVLYERTDILPILLKHLSVIPSSVLNQYNHEGMTPLLICSVKGLFECTEALLSMELDINLRDQISGRTALFHAAERKDLPMVELLLNYNADTKIKNFFGTSAHDAMYEIEEIPTKIKNLILGKTLKRKTTEDTRGMAKPRRHEDMKKMCLKTYARFEKIDMTIKTFKKI